MTLIVTIKYTGSFNKRKTLKNRVFMILAKKLITMYKY